MRGELGMGAAGNTIIQLSVNDYILETLVTFDAAELEQESDDEEDGYPSWSSSCRRRRWSNGGPYFLHGGPEECEWGRAQATTGCVPVFHSLAAPFAT